MDVSKQNAASEITDEHLEKVFKAFLTPLVIPRLVQLSPSILGDEQRELLKTLYAHYVEPTRKKRGRPPKKDLERADSPLDPKIDQSGVQSWKAIIRLEELRLEPMLQTYIKLNNVEKFLQDSSTTLVESAPSEELDPQEALAECIFEVRRQRTIHVTAAVHYLFRILLISDVFCAMYGQFQEWDKKELRRLTDFIHAKYIQMSDEQRRGLNFGEHDTKMQISKNLADLVYIGKNLDWFCEQYGTGSLFWLYSTFTMGFLLHRWTKKGGAWEEARKKLDSLGLFQKVKESGANTFGDAIRKHFKTLYNVDTIEFQHPQQPENP